MTQPDAEREWKVSTEALQAALDAYDGKINGRFVAEFGSIEARIRAAIEAAAPYIESTAKAALAKAVERIRKLEAK